MMTKDEKFKELLAKADALAATKPREVQVEIVADPRLGVRLTDHMPQGSGGGSGGMRGDACNYK